MKIVCDNCATKYSIADEKVRGKVFKIRCKKCSHVIVVRGNEDAQGGDVAGLADSGYDGEDATSIATSSPPLSGDPGWHLAIDQEQIGPMTADEVRTRIASGQVNAETFAWREGFDDWQRLGSIEEFIHDVAAVPSAGDATVRADIGAAMAAHAASGGPAPASPAMGTTDDFFAAAQPVFPGTSAADAPQAAAAPKGGGFVADPGSNGSGGAKLTGQRNENSVLFSLNNLQGLATAPKAAPNARAPEPPSEGSGLLDIRKMAAQTLPGAGASNKRDAEPMIVSAPVISPVVAPPVLLPTQQSGLPKWIWAVVGGGVLLVGGIVAILVVLLTHKPEPVVVAQLPTAPSGVAPVAAPPPSPAAAGTSPATAPGPAAANPEAATAERGTKPDRTKSDKSDKGAKTAKIDKGKSEVPVTSSKPAAAPAVAAATTKKPPKGGDTSLDDLLDGAAPTAKARPKAAAAEEPSGGGGDLPDTPSRNDIQRGLGGVQGRAKACYNQFHVPGTVLVKLVIANSGRVQSATPAGVLANTPTGDCVVKAVRGATFPRFKSPSFNVTYPFILP